MIKKKSDRLCKTTGGFRQPEVQSFEPLSFRLEL